MFSKKFLVGILFLNLVVFFGASQIVSDKVEAAKLGWKWTTTNSNGAVVKVNNLTLGSEYSDSFANGYKKWNSSAARISISSTSTVGKGVISFHEVPQSTWAQNGWGTGEAWAQPMNVDAPDMQCIKHQNDTFAAGCKNKVTQGIVWANSSGIGNSKRREGVIAHEIGHIVGLAHNTHPISKSIMTPNLKDGYDIQSLDVQDINELY